MTLKKLRKSYKKNYKRAKKTIRKGNKYGNRILNNIDDYFEMDRRNALKFKRKGKIRL